MPSRDDSTRHASSSLERNMIDLDFLQYDFMRNALAAGLVASVLCGIIGIYVILNKIVFISDGIAHAAFGGVRFFYYFPGPRSAGLLIVSAVATALGIGMVSLRARISEDTAIGVFMATGMALGIMLLTLSQGYARDLYGYLFGNILAVTGSDVLLIVVLTLIILVLVFLLYKEFLLLSFDPIYAEAIGLPVRSLRLLLLAMVAFSVVILIKRNRGHNHGHSTSDHPRGHKPAAYERSACYHGLLHLSWCRLCNHRALDTNELDAPLWSDHNSDGSSRLFPEHSAFQIDRLN